MYKKLLIGTTNANKVTRLKNLLTDVPIAFLSLADLEETAIEPEETAKTCMSIAAQKAVVYADYVAEDTLVLTQDDTITFERVEAHDDPGAHIKQPVVDTFGTFTDENAIRYYTELASKYGGEIPMTFVYGHALAYRKSSDRDYLHILAGTSRLNAKLVTTVTKPEKFPGYFLAAIMQIEINGTWHTYADLDEQQLIDADSDLKASITSLLKQAEII